jgi:hypothetical protein
MSVLHLTLHAYRSWRADHPDGYTSKSDGVLPPDPYLASRWDNRAKQPPVEFDDAMQDVLIAGTIDFCQRRNLRCHGGAADPTHLHTVISSVDGLDPKVVRKELKNILSLFLGRWTGEKGRRWWVDEGYWRVVKDQSHFDHLFAEYFPGHKRWWCESDAPPVVPRHVLR